jgi:hypothetical protein
MNAKKRAGVKKVDFPYMPTLTLDGNVESSILHAMVLPPASVPFHILRNPMPRARRLESNGPAETNNRCQAFRQ